MVLHGISGTSHYLPLGAFVPTVGKDFSAVAYKTAIRKVLDSAQYALVVRTANSGDWINSPGDWNRLFSLATTGQSDNAADITNTIGNALYFQWGIEVNGAGTIEVAVELLSVPRA